MRKFLSTFFAFLAILTSNVMCLVVAYNYRDMLCGTLHSGFSAPPSIAFLYAIPFVIAIVIFALLAKAIRKK